MKKTICFLFSLTSMTILYLLYGGSGASVFHPAPLFFLMLIISSLLLMVSRLGASRVPSFISGYVSSSLSDQEKNFAKELGVFCQRAGFVAFIFCLTITLQRLSFDIDIVGSRFASSIVMLLYGQIPAIANHFFIE